MNYGSLEYDKLHFLSEYGFQVQNNSNGKYIEIFCTKNNFCITYHEWPQFGDFNIFITSNIDEYKKYHYNQTYGLGWLLDNISPENKKKINVNKLSKIELVELYIRQQINEDKTIWGIPVN